MNTIITFEEEEVQKEEMESRIRDITAKYPWLVMEEDGEIIGYAYASQWKSRCAYRYSVEITIYLAEGFGGRGFGRQLYSALFAKLEKTDVHSLIGGVAVPNEASMAIHRNMGFQEVAHFREVGFKFNKWIDVVYWEKIIGGQGIQTA